MKRRVGRRIGWIDSTGQPSSIHLTTDGIDTVCKQRTGYIGSRQLAKVPKKVGSRSKFCRKCFSRGGKGLPWDDRCIDVDWGGPASVKVAKR